MALTRILEVGSRDYAIRAPAAEAKEVRKQFIFDLDQVNMLPLIPSWVAKCDMTVLEHTRSPQETMLKRKRRKGYQRMIKHKQGWTRLRVGDIILGDGVPHAEMDEKPAEGLM